MLEDRAYQATAVHEARQLLRQHRSTLLNSPTGSGKTVCSAIIIRGAVQKGSRVLFLAHRRELVDQCSRKLDEFGVVYHGVIMRGHVKARNRHAPVQVASIQTLIRRELPPADLIIIDEAHRAVAKSYLDVLGNYPAAKVVGLTATPERTDGKGLDALFESMVTVANTPELIEAGFLMRPEVWVAPSGLDIKSLGIKRKRGDYTQEEMGKIEAAMDTPKLCGDIVAHYLKHAAGKPAAVFATGIQHSQHLCQAFRDAGVLAEHVDGTTPTAQRDAIVARWKNGEIHVVCNVGVFVEGFDFPGLYACILARPTKSVTVYLQEVGRVMRPAPGKTSCLVLDHAGCVDEHGAPDEARVWTLQGETKRRRKSFFARTCRCGFHFEANPKLFLAEIQDGTVHPEIAEKQRAVLKMDEKAQALVQCPACREADCVVCRTPFVPQMHSRHHEGTSATYRATVCPACESLYAENAVHEETVQEESLLPDEADAELVRLDGERAADARKKIEVKNAFNRLMDEAKRARRKRGWVFHRIIEQFGDDAKQYIPKRRGEWWRQVAE